jgi:HK97 family phage prohead protease
MSELRRLSTAAEWKTVSGSDAGELEGYASVFGNVDQGGDVVLPGAFKRTLHDWSHARQPLPLLADHQLSTDGVIGSVVHAVEDHFGLKVRARFSSDPKAQSVRTKMIEGHLRGMSFTYEPKKSYAGEKDGRRVRFLQEVRLFETTITPFPMNQLAVASAKAGPDEQDADLERLQQLEQWAAGNQARAVLSELMENPDTMAAAAGILSNEKAARRLAELEQWAAASQHQRMDPQQQAAELHRTRRDRDNAYSTALAGWKANVRDCGHRSCMPGACRYGR